MNIKVNNFGKISAYMVDDGLLDIDCENTAVELEEVTELPAEIGWHYGPEGLTPPEGWFAFELANMPGSYYVSNIVNEIIDVFAYERSEGYAPCWIYRPQEATNKVIRRVMEKYYI